MIQIFDDFLCADGCEEMIALAQNRFKESTMVVGGRIVTNTARTSTTCHLQRAETELVQLLESTVANIIKVPIEHIEPLQIVRYDKGQEYRPHFDYFDQTDNQRVHTFLVYLNRLEDSDGGATYFPTYGARIQPRMGRCLYFRNMDENGNVNENTLHGGEKILTDAVKYAINIWTREKPYSGPPRS